MCPMRLQMRRPLVLAVKPFHVATLVRAPERGRFVGQSMAFHVPFSVKSLAAVVVTDVRLVAW